MKRRILSLLISLALCVSLCPAAVLAEEEQPAEPTQTVTEGGTQKQEPEETTPTENVPGGGITEENPETKPENTDTKPKEPGDTETKPEEPEDTETNPETPGETETKPETPENPEIKPEVPENPEVPEGTETKLETPDKVEENPAEPTDEKLCPHHKEHTEECGHGEETPCTYQCRLCPIDALIIALPEAVTDENADDVQAQLDEILKLYTELTEEEQEQIDLSHILELQAALDAAKKPAPIPTEGPITTPLDFTNVGDGEGQTPAVGPGYKWSGDAESGYLLELDNFQMELAENTNWLTAILFPNKGHTIIQVKGNNIIEAPGWNGFRAKVSNHSVGPYVDEDSISVEGVGEGASLTIHGHTAIRSTYALEIRNVKIQSVTELSGITSHNRGIILENVEYQNINKGKSAACIFSPNGSVNIQNSTLDLQCTEDMGICVRDGNLTVNGSEISVSSGNYGAGIYVYFTTEEGSGNVSFSGETKVDCSSIASFGIFAKGKLVVSAPAEIIAKGASAAFAVIDGITLNGVAVTKPENGIITPPSETSNVYTVRVEGTAAQEAEIKPVELMVTLDKTAYEQGDTPQATVTGGTGLKGVVSIYKGEQQIGTGNLGEQIALAISELQSGSHTLTAKLAENKGDASQEFTILIKTSPSVTNSPTATLQYGEPLSAAALKGGTVTDPESGESIEGTWSWKDGTVFPAVNNEGYIAVFTPSDQSKYSSVEQTVKLAVTPKPLTVTGATATNRAYNGTNKVQIAAVTLGGKVGADEVSVNTTDLTGTVSGSNAATYTAVTLPELTLTGAAAENYTLIQPAGAVQTSVTISKADPLTPKIGDLPVVNKHTHVYTFGLGALRPNVSAGMSLGSSAVTYILGTVSLGDYYTDGAAIDGQTLTLPIQAVESTDAEEIGTVTVTIHTDNFEDMTATIKVRSVNKILPEGEPQLSANALTYSQALKEITLSGTMWDSKNNKDVPGTFTWSSPENRPAAQESYSAAWTFTPDDNDTYAIVTGTVGIRVNPAPIANAVITLKPAAFRHDGTAHSPEITSVKLGDTLLVANVDFIAEIPSGTDAGSYTVTITGKGNYKGMATVEFKINPVETSDITLPDNTEAKLTVESGLTSVPGDLSNHPEFNNIPAIENKLRTQVTNAMRDPNTQVSVYDVRLQYLDGGVWKDVDPDNFPVGGVTAVLPYPDGTNGTDYTFNVQHMISHTHDDMQAGTVEDLPYTPDADGLRCTFTSLSPVAVGYKLKEKTPATPSTPSTPGTLFTDSDSDDDEEEAPDPEYDFWQTVREQIRRAQTGGTVKVNARGYDRMPASVMEALKKKDDVTLRIRWSGGEEIVIPSAKALSEPLRIYYPLSYLAKYDFGEPAVPEAPEHLNPATGGDIEIEAPLTAEAPLDTAGEPLVTDARRGLAETEEQAEKGVEKAIPGVYEPEAPAATSIEPAVSGQPEADRGGILPLVLALVAAAICGGVWVWKNKLRKSK